jgi:sulfur carrier protein
VKILYNGNNYILEYPSTVLEFLEIKGKSNIPKMVRLNDNFLPKNELENTMLKEGDSLNVVLFMGGG